jgi:hypothetical protein
MRYSLLLTACLLIACGTKPTTGPDAARLNLALTFEAPDLRGYAAVDTEAELAKLTPQKLQLLICDNVKLSAQVKVFCSVSQNDFNYKILFDDFNAGSGTAANVPPANNQVFVAQGLAADGSVTYQGFATLPTIEPRVTYDVSIQMVQTKFPELPKPDAPNITQPSASGVTVPSSATTFTFKGTRVANSRLRISSPPAFDLGGVRQFNGDEPPIYDEKVLSDGTIGWSLTVDLPSLSTRTSPQRYMFDFDVSRTGEDKFSDKVTVTLSLCSQTNSCLAP